MRACLTLFLVIFCGAFSVAQAEKRAFVVGVGEYAYLNDLTKTIADSEGYSDAFRNNLGFQVTPLKNPSRIEFLSRFDGFLQTVSPGDDVAFVFSGHGWSDGAENYLALADAPRSASEYVLKDETVAISRRILLALKDRNPRLIVAIIDACRDNPFDSLTMNAFGKGMVRTEIPQGTLVLYSAGARQKALDRLSDTDSERYSVFTRVLLPKLRNPKVPLMRAADEARSEVQRLASTINHSQRPALYSDVSIDFCFAGNCVVGPQRDPENALWVEIMTAGRSGESCANYKRYVDRYPNGRFTDRAERFAVAFGCPKFSDPLYGLAPAVEVEDWTKTKRLDSVIAYESYLEVYPDGTFVREANARLAELKSPDETHVGSSNPVIAMPASLKEAVTRPVTDEDILSAIQAAEAGAPVEQRAFKECDVCPEMVVVPAGRFVMGSPESETGGPSDEGPTHTVVISKPFAVGKFEVTWAEWERCVVVGGCYEVRNNGFGRGTRPVTYVSWEDAKAYVRWLSRETGEDYRLLSEAEWEYAARAGTTSAYWWGNSIGSNNANCFDCGDSYDKTAPVGSFRPNAFGLYDMSGNVWEWVEDCHGDYSGAPTDGSARQSCNTEYRVKRGGSWGSTPSLLRLADRNGSMPDIRDSGLGFRVARDIEK